MVGTVAADGSEPLLPLVLLGGVGNGSGLQEDVEAVIDTGFDGELTLQEATIRQLGYPYSGSAGGTLADGSEVQFDYYEGRGLWHGYPPTTRDGSRLLRTRNTRPRTGAAAGTASAWWRRWWRSR
jgi:hypothetical protein